MRKRTRLGDQPRPRRRAKTSRHQSSQSGRSKGLLEVVGGRNGDFSRAALTWAEKSMGPPTPTRTRSTKPCAAHVHNVALYARTYDTVGQQSMRDRLESYVSAIKFVSASRLARLKVRIDSAANDLLERRTEDRDR